jgi:hypothetical protein
VTFGSHRRRIWSLIRIAEPFAHGLLSRGSQVRILPGALARQVDFSAERLHQGALDMRHGLRVGLNPVRFALQRGEASALDRDALGVDEPNAALRTVLCHRGISATSAPNRLP